MATTTRFRVGDRVRVTHGRVWVGQTGSVESEHEDLGVLRVLLDGDVRTLPFGPTELELVESAPINVPGGRDDGADLPPDPIEVTRYQGEMDGRPVVQIDTAGLIGPLRVNLNDGTIWDGDPEGDADPRDDALDRIADVYADGGSEAFAMHESIRAILRDAGRL